MAASQGNQSPMIIQISYNSMNLSGGKESSFEPPIGVLRNSFYRPAVSGAQLSVDVIKNLVIQYNAKYVAISLDHFNVPLFDKKIYGSKPSPKNLVGELARARIDDALEHMESAFVRIHIDDEVLNAYVNYLSSPEYFEFKMDFINVVYHVNPAWGMIDTENLPPILCFAVTKEISDAIRKELGNKDIILEAEFGATAVSGERLEYKPLKGKALKSFADGIVSFIKYTGAEGIAYPIGMAHAAKIGERHEPDIKRLETVQRSLFLETGEYIPFAQHGGTGAAKIIHGLVGKDNINTKYLVASSIAFADHYDSNRVALRSGDKKVCGTKVYKIMTRSIYDACTDMLKKTRSYQKGLEL
jgi:fructose/tagatose bisphosphate aldolase